MPAAPKNRCWEIGADARTWFSASVIICAEKIVQQQPCRRTCLQKKHLSTKCINKINNIQPAPVRRTVVEAWPTATQKFSTEHSEISRAYVSLHSSYD
jgi:hypothetical protein